jgi:hypothetical protein
MVEQRAFYLINVYFDSLVWTWKKVFTHIDPLSGSLLQHIRGKVISPSVFLAGSNDLFFLKDHFLGTPIQTYSS